jgi:maltose phosphorylase
MSEALDLFKCKKVENFKRELNMKEGWLLRSFNATLQNNLEVEVSVKRFLSLDMDELGVISYSKLSHSTLHQHYFLNLISIAVLPMRIAIGMINFGIRFSVSQKDTSAFIQAKTMKTEFIPVPLWNPNCFIMIKS